MKLLTIIALVLAQLFSVPAVSAATLEDVPQAGPNAQFRAGTFAGARIRVAMGGQKKAARLRAGLTFAAMQSGQSARGASFMRFGEGLEFGITDREIQPQMSLAGYSLAAKRLGAADDDKAQKKGRSALGTAALIAGGLLLGVAGFYAIVISQAESD